MRSWWRRWGAESNRPTPEYIQYVLETRYDGNVDQEKVDGLLKDLERYFVTRDAGDRVLGIGSKGAAVQNLRIALSHLGYPDLDRNQGPFDAELSAALRKLQADHQHTSVDGLFGPGTRALLTRTLFEKDCRCFGLLVDPEMRHDGHAFISYASSDRGSAAGIAEIVRRLGYSVWWDQEIAGGERWNDEISRQLGAAFLVISVNSMNAAASKWVKREISVADKLEKLILPINIESTLPPNDLTVFFNNVQPIERQADDFVDRLRLSLARAHEQWRASRK